MRVLVGLLLVVFAGSSQFQPSETDEILAQLSKIRLDKKQIYNIRDITIRRDTASISFNRGTIAFLEPIKGKVTGAVFIGSGEVVAIPPDAVEKQQIHKYTNSPILNEPFAAAFFRFTDDTYDEIVKAYQEHAHEDVSDDEASQFLPWDKILTDRSGVLNYRILADYLGTPRPLFFAELNGDRTGWFDLLYDARFLEEVAIMKVHEQGTSFSLDVWASFNKRSEARDLAAAARENKLPLDVLSYTIDATIAASTQLEASATLRARALIEGERVISFDLSRFLRVSAVTGNNGESIPFFQHVGLNDEEIRRSTLNSIVVVLPQPTKQGQEITLKFTYAGDVIEKKGSGIFYVGERGLWYPNFGTADRARFNLTFHFPTSYSLVATGHRTREWEENGKRHSTWESDGEFALAGFNLGDFTILSDTSGPVPISVGVNNDVETIYMEVAGRRAMQREMALRAAATLGRRGASPQMDAISIAPDVNIFSTRGLAENVLKGVKDTLTFFIDKFGPYPYSQLTVSQFPVNYSQGWPSLLYVSTLSFFTKEQRDKLGLRSESDFMVTEMVRAHEVAHQWFGNKVGWDTYHDQWISEAFANYAGAMYIEQKYKDPARLREILEDARRRILDKAPDGTVYDSVGPIWLGQRLTSTAVPNGYGELTYAKGTWIVHMLRMLMRSEAGSDENFFEMVRDLLNPSDGNSVSTWDLKRLVEKYQTKTMDVRTDKKLDWFFDEWIFQTGIPSYSLEYKVRADGKAFVVEGRITQSGVPDNFIMPVPLYGDDQLLGTVVVSDDQGSFRFSAKTRPSKVTIDPHFTVLAQIQN